MEPDEIIQRLMKKLDLDESLRTSMQRMLNVILQDPYEWDHKASLAERLQSGSIDLTPHEQALQTAMDILQTEVVNAYGEVQGVRSTLNIINEMRLLANPVEVTTSAVMKDLDLPEDYRPEVRALSDARFARALQRKGWDDGETTFAVDLKDQSAREIAATDAKRSLHNKILLTHEKYETTSMVEGIDSRIRTSALAISGRMI